MKYSFLLFFLLLNTGRVLAQTEPVRPNGCGEKGLGQTNILTLSGSASFTFNTASDFDVSKTQNLTATVNASHGYKLYVAGEITYSSTGIPFPLNAFTIAASNKGNSPTSITLSNQYQEIAQSNTTGKNVSHDITVTRLALDLNQVPAGTYTLTLHFRYCQ